MGNDRIGGEAVVGDLTQSRRMACLVRKDFGFGLGIIIGIGSTDAGFAGRVVRIAGLVLGM